MNILIADDEKHFRLLLTKLFRDSYNIIEHDTGDTALLDVKYHLCKPTQYDLVILDKSMPGMDGIQVLKEIRKAEVNAGIKSTERTKIILITSDSHPDTRFESFQNECDAFISKPLVMSKVAKKFDKLGIKIKNIADKL